jgi:hypothetical protein
MVVIHVEVIIVTDSHKILARLLERVGDVGSLSYFWLASQIYSISACAVIKERSMAGSLPEAVKNWVLQHDNALAQQ